MNIAKLEVIFRDSVRSGKNSFPLADKRCRVAGWGQMNDLDEFPEHLLEVEIPIMDLEKCKANYEREPRYEGMVTDFNFCAGRRGKDSCFGDSGGPMICDEKLAGIVSFGPNGECGNEDLPGVYTDVSIFSEVIERTFRTKISPEVTYFLLPYFIVSKII